jgi:hypothetical protein
VTVNHNCILVIRISLCRWSEHRPKYAGETVVNNIHRTILSALYWLFIYFWISILYCHADQIALHVTGSSDVGSCNNGF